MLTVTSPTLMAYECINTFTNHIKHTKPGADVFSLPSWPIFFFFSCRLLFADLEKRYMFYFPSAYLCVQREPERWFAVLRCLTQRCEIQTKFCSHLQMCMRCFLLQNNCITSKFHVSYKWGQEIFLLFPWFIIATPKQTIVSLNFLILLTCLPLLLSILDTQW